MYYFAQACNKTIKKIQIEELNPSLSIEKYFNAYHEIEDSRFFEMLMSSHKTGSMREEFFYSVNKVIMLTWSAYHRHLNSRLISFEIVSVVLTIPNFPINVFVLSISGYDKRNINMPIYGTF